MYLHECVYYIASNLSEDEIRIFANSSEEIEKGYSYFVNKANETQAVSTSL